MANFNSPKAPGRNMTEPKKPAVAGGQSNQLRMTGTGSKSMGNGNAGSNQVKFAANTKGTNTLKDALNSYKQTLKPAVVGNSLG